MSWTQSGFCLQCDGLCPFQVNILEQVPPEELVKARGYVIAPRL